MDNTFYLQNPYNFRILTHTDFFFFKFLILFKFFLVSPFLQDQKLKNFLKK